MIWILNGAHRTPADKFINLAQEACALVHTEGEPDDPDGSDDSDAIAAPLMYDAGVYFLCDIVQDVASKCYRIPWGKTFNPTYITIAYEQGTLHDIRHLLGAGEVRTGPRQRQPNTGTERTSNRTSNQTIKVQDIRPAERPLPQITNRLDGRPIPNPVHPQGVDVDYFQHHGGGNREHDDDDNQPDNQDPQNPLKCQVQLILEQMYYDILQESPNKRNRNEGAWTNIPGEFREQLAVENLYSHLHLPFTAVQYQICTPELWAKHFDRFFPSQLPKGASQNFKKSRYYHIYLDLVRRLSPMELSPVRQELRQKFNTIAWMPWTEADRMWCTKKMTSRNWKYLPENGAHDGPKIAINPRVLQVLQERPRLRPPPRVEEVHHEDDHSEDGGDTNGDVGE